MFTKSFIIFGILILFVDHFEGKSTLHKSSEGENNKRVKCFKPDKPDEMPQDVYEKYKISSRHLNEQDKKDFWTKFVGWWKNIFAQIGKFFEKVGNFFKNLFTSKKNQRESTTVTPTTEPPPTPNPQKIRKDKNVLICVEYEKDPKDPNIVVTTKIYEVDVTTAALTTTTTALTTEIEKLVTTEEDIKTSTFPEREEFETQKVVPKTTPFDPNRDNQNTISDVIGREEKAKEEEENTDATVVRAV